MTAAAVYARKSTLQHVADEAKSVTRQVELAVAFAQTQGFEVAPEHIYVTTHSPARSSTDDPA